MKRIICLVLALVMMGTLLTACGGSAAETTTAAGGDTTQAGSGETTTGAQVSADAVEIKIATVGNEKHQSTLAANFFKEKLEEVSGGSMTATIYPNASLGGEREEAEGVKLGTIEMTIVTTDSTLPSWVPEVQVLSIPYLFANKEEAYYILDEVLQDEFAPLFEAQGFKHLGFVELGFRHFTNNVREVVKAEDMNGLSIRVQEAPIWFALMDALGATATPVSFNELYTALQQKMVDGQENPITSIAASGFDEVQKYMVLDGHTYAAESIIMNLSFYNNLTDEQKVWVEEAVAYAIPAQRAAVDSMEEGYLEQIRGNGVTVSEPDLDSFKAATADLYKRPEVTALVSPELVEMIMTKLAERR